MSASLSASTHLAALRAEGLDVVEHPGWRTHSRTAPGRPWGPVHGVLIHHTAGRSSVATVWGGRSDLPGPLAHGLLAKSGVLTVTSAGRANHAGPVAKNAFAAVLAESAKHPAPSVASGTVDGNTCFYGLEIENLGDGADPYPDAQYDAAVRWAAALCRAHGWSAHSAVGHKETSVEGKPDPSFDMHDFRRAVAERLAHGPDWNPLEESDMPSTLGLYDDMPRTLRPGAWTTLPVEHTDLLSGAVAYDALALVTVKAPVGSTVQGRFFHVREDGTRWQSGIVERAGTTGDTFADFGHKGSIGKKEKLRLEVVYYPATPDDEEPVTVSAARVRALYWKAS
ncbi:N-acetylmuramoyl-L-alanine amidase [Streptomyces sp. NPDC088768]|uniref:N-acetylmuramoyl-L-alanine amidase n=1 Tax=Streptomyces sp. NPDC088768 TaxID=3365894 RepID=UPI00382902B2